MINPTSVVDMNPLSYIPDKKIPKAIKIAQDASLANIRCLDNFYNDFDWTIADNELKRKFLFPYYNSAKILYGGLEAYEMSKEKNLGMEEPLSEYDFLLIIIETDLHEEKLNFHDDGVCSFAPATIAGPKWLNLTEADAVKYGFLDNIIKKKGMEENQKESVQRDFSICCLYSQGYSYTEISEELSKRYRHCHEKTVKRSLIRLDMIDNRAKQLTLEEVEQKKRYQRRRTTFTKDIPMRVKNVDAQDDFIGEHCGDLYNKLVCKVISPSEQADALDKLKAGVQAFLTGRAGAGKSTVLCNYYKNLSKEEQDVTLIVTPTGAASERLVIPSKTIHSAFRLMKGHVYSSNDGIIEQPWFRSVKRIIIDEISLVRIDVFEYIMRAIQHIESKYNNRIQIILSGDFGQIGPVVSNKEKAIMSELYDKKVYTYQSELWTKGQFEHIVLYQNRRGDTTPLTQAFFDVMEKVKFGSYKALVDAIAMVSHEEDASAIYLCTKNKLVDYYNSRYINGFDNCRTYKAAGRIKGGPKAILELAEGMRVTALMNTNTYKNGSLGEVVELLDDGIRVKFRKNGKLGRACKVGYEDFIDENGKVMRQLPIAVAGAITVHKSQGITLDEDKDKVNVVLEGYFPEGALYVALTRCKNIENLHAIGKLKRHYLKVDIDALKMCVN